MAGSRGPSVVKRGSQFFQFSRKPNYLSISFKFILRFLRRRCCFAVEGNIKTIIYGTRDMQKNVIQFKWLHLKSQDVNQNEFRYDVEAVLD